jgi:hypothetical protein
VAWLELFVAQFRADHLPPLDKGLSVRFSASRTGRELICSGTEARAELVPRQQNKNVRSITGIQHPPPDKRRPEP